jgi:hypothetical protein
MTSFSRHAVRLTVILPRVQTTKLSSFTCLKMNGTSDHQGWSTCEFQIYLNFHQEIDEKKKSTPQAKMM